MRKSCTVSSCQAAGRAGKTLIVSPQDWQTMSCSDWAADSGVSMTGPDSLYMVLAWMNRLISWPRYFRASSPLPSSADMEPRR